jgi:hypothetical protein
VIIAFLFSSSGTQTWTPDKDYVLTYAYCSNTGQSGLVSTEANLAGSGVNAPSATRITYDILAFCRATTGISGIGPLKVPMLKDRQYFVSSSGQNGVLIEVMPVET